MIKKLVAVLLLASFLLAGCLFNEQAPDEIKTKVPLGFHSEVDFEDSIFKHITNGGITDDETLPYNIDAITGATTTVEGPAIVTSIPLSVREMENRTEGFYRGVYEDETGPFIYEGLDLYYLLHQMTEGDNGIILTDQAYKVILKDRNRSTISELTLEEIRKAHEDKMPILLAFGIGTLDGTSAAPFVFDAEAEGEYSLGYVKELDNQDGCTRLVYDVENYGNNPEYERFTNVAYIYIAEETEPGFKHTESPVEEFAKSGYMDYIVTFRGSALGYEMNFTVEDLESLVVYDKDGQIKPGGIGYSDHYSLANSTYWYVNEYEGLDLYKMLLYLGMDDAQTMGLADARTTLVNFIAADGMPAQETFSVDTLSYPDGFGFYNKNAGDLNDGDYQSTNADLVETGYPVLLAYGVNNYPYTIHKTDDPYLSGLSNNGGPMRVVFGKTQYHHPNGSHQVQYLKDVIVGQDVLYNTHRYSSDPRANQLAEDPFTIKVFSESQQLLINQQFTVGDLESLIYDETVTSLNKKAAQVKDIYQVDSEKGMVSDFYEGVDFNYLLMEHLGIPGTNGTATFSNGDEEVTVTLESLFALGYNNELQRDSMSSLLAFSKNGAPLVPNKSSDGFLESRPLNPFLDSDPADYKVDNDGGPLQLIIPSSNPDTSDAKTLRNLTSMTIQLVPDSYAHIEAPYQEFDQNTIRFYGDGLEKEHSFTVKDLESKQTQVDTLDFSLLNSQGVLSQARYRGLALYDLFTEIGIKNNAGDVTIYDSEGASQSFSLSQLKKQNYENFMTENSDLYAMLAFGKGHINNDMMTGLPLVPTIEDSGYDKTLDNKGGPLTLILPQEEESHANTSSWINDVVAIEVSANEIEGWGHKMSDVYEEFLDYEMTFSLVNDDSEWSHIFTLEELEMLDEIILRDHYTVLDLGNCEGLDIWKFIQLFAGDVPGIDDPISVTAYASDGYKNDLLSFFYKKGLVEGVSADTGDPKKLIIAYAINGYPLVDDESHEGYTGLARNGSGPLRIVAETNQGASVKHFNKLTVTIPGSGPIEVTIDENLFSKED